MTTTSKSSSATAGNVLVPPGLLWLEVLSFDLTQNFPRACCRGLLGPPVGTEVTFNLHLTVDERKSLYQLVDRMVQRLGFPKEPDGQ